MVRFFAGAALVILSSATSGTLAQDLPSGWRLPTRDELSDKLRAKSPTRFAKASADFNGDGVVDHAFLLRSTRFNGEGLWVQLSDGQHGYAWIRLDVMDWGPEEASGDSAMAIDVVAPGIHPYACFEHAPDCNFGPYHERPRLKLRDPSLLYFKLESASTSFFWSNKSRRFLRVWLSD